MAAASPLDLSFTLRHLTAADHAARARGAAVAQPQTPDPIRTLRNAHHAAARLLAGGASDAHAAALLGWAPSRVRAMRNSPAFQELLSLYVERRDEIVTDLGARMELVAQDTLALLHDRLLDEKSAKEIADGTLLEIFRTIADRVGYGATARSVNTHLVVAADADRLREVASRERVVVTEDVRAALAAPAAPQVALATCASAEPPS